MNKFYTAERNVQILISILKAKNIKKVVASPGTTNMTLVASLQYDPFFEIYSSIDERSAAYIACGLAAESGETVVLSCTGATASRNYMPGLTEAFYRKLPILAVTSTQHIGRVGSYTAQVIDRSSLPNDIAKFSTQLPTINSNEDEWTCNVAVNKAILELTRGGGGPVHINLATTYNQDFSIRELPPTRLIDRITINDQLPKIDDGKIAIFVGSHIKWSDELTSVVDEFCRKHNAIVICDHTSNYIGGFKIMGFLISSQQNYINKSLKVNTLIHIGDVSGAYININAEKLWRVNPDGEIRDLFKNTRYVFEMNELDFFKKYNSFKNDNMNLDSYIKSAQNEYNYILDKLPEIPFSNIWIASQTIKKLPQNSVLHLGILNSLRSWNYFEISNTISCYSNTGGFGIDGCISSLIGAALADKNKLFFGVFGDLAFFYDMNSLGNRHLPKNIRILLINNGCGTEFKNYSHHCAKFGDDADLYMAAGGHYGSKSPNLVKNYTQDLGFKYLNASNKKEYLEQLNIFLDQKIANQPIVFEIFTNSQDESNALKIINNIEKTPSKILVRTAMGIVGDARTQKIKKLLNFGNFKS